MKVQYSYLKNFLKTNLSQAKLADIFTQVGFECEIEGSLIEFDITPNRGDVLSLRGLEREFLAYQSKKSFKNLKIFSLDSQKNKSIINNNYYNNNITQFCSKLLDITMAFLALFLGFDLLLSVAN